MADQQLHQLSARSNNFDALRLLGALLVLFSHQFALCGRDEPRLVGDHSFGNLGVLIFFAVSGHLVTVSWMRDPNLVRFLLRRGLRILPGLVVAMLVCAPVLAWLLPETFSWPDYLLHLWYAQFDPWFPGQPQTLLNGSLWTIPIEIMCYLILCVMGLVARGHLAKLVAAGSVALLTWYLAVLGGQVGLDRANLAGQLSFLPYFGAFFLLGAALALLPSLRRHALWIAAAGLVALAIGQHTLALALVVAPLVVTIGAASWPMLREAGRFGDLSYGIYVYAWPVQQLGVYALGKDQPYPLLLAFSLVGAITLGWLSWHLVERRVLSFKPRFTPDRPRRSLAQRADGAT